MTQLEEWASQYRSELEKLSSARAAQVESLLIVGDYTAIREWLDEWEAEDKAPDSLRNRYRQTLTELRAKARRSRRKQDKDQAYG